MTHHKQEEAVMIRLFAGIELPEDIKEQLYALRGGVPNAKWVEKDNLHITLRFIGNIDEDDANDLHDGFSQLQAPAFDLQMAQVGFFANGLQMRHLWAGVSNYQALDFLHDKLESYLSKGNIAAIIYSNPNNPSWICLKEKELAVIGQLATQYDTIVLEDLAYFAMDFRKDLSCPFQPPFQPSVARYTDNYILLISGSKAFSYAGQRIGVVAISDKLYQRTFEGLTQRYGGGTFGSVFIHRALYAISSGVSHSAQYAMAAMLKAASDGTYNFLAEVKEYGRRAQKLKEIFHKHGFHLVYDSDLGDPVADGFYFTIGYPGLTGGELMKELIYYGISSISLVTTGSQQEGIRACTSFIKDHQYDLLDERLALFKAQHP